MAAIAPFLFTEGRLNVEPASPDSLVHLPTETTSLFSPRKRIKLDEQAGQDEETYSRKHLATEGSVYFRSKSRHPRSFLWRILDERKVLEIQCVDLVQSRHIKHDSLCTFVLSFTQPIRHNGVAFADPEDHDALEIFVLTTGNELFTFSLRKDLLMRSVASSSDPAPSNHFKSYTPSSLGFRHPYKLFATSSLELLIALHDGGLLRLERKTGDNGSKWRETFFSEGGWGSSLRGLIPWKGHNTVRFDDMDLEPSTATAVALSPDREHVYTVSLDHTLKAWNARTGKTGAQTDLLGDNRRDPSMAAPYIMNATQGTLLRVLQVDGQMDGDAYYVVTFSPKEQQFKFWAVRDADSVANGIRDVQPDVKLIPPLDDLMHTKVWQLAEFHILPGSGWKDAQIWIRALSGSSCRIFTLTFDLLSSDEDLADAWHNKWAVVDDGSLSIEKLVDSSQYPRDAESATQASEQLTTADRWLDFLFYPDRFDTTMLETALFIYRRASDSRSTKKLTEPGKPLKERLCNAVTDKVPVRRTAEGHADLERHRSDTAAQWNAFFGLVRHLHQRRADPLSLAFDAETGLAWSVRADQFGPLRACSELEVLEYNQQIFASQDEEWIVNSLPLADSLPDEASIDVARLLAAARSFRSNLSTSFDHDFTRMAALYALRDGGSVKNIQSGRRDNALHELYEGCGFAAEVSDEDFERLADAVQDLGSLGEIENDIFIAALSRLTEVARGQEREQMLTRYGDKVTIRGAQEALELGHGILLDLLCMVVFVSQDLEPQELAPGFKANELYRILVSRLRQYDVLLWLARNVRQDLTKKERESMSDASQMKTAPARPAYTVFESIFMGDWTSLRFSDESMPSLITYWCRAWTFGLEIESAYEGATSHVLGNLIKHEDYRLGVDFLRFVPDNDWSFYLKARLFLAEGEFGEATELFRRASGGLAQRTKVKIESLDTAGLLSPEERSFFSDGLPRYFSHVASLFEASRLLSYTADFAALALLHLEGEAADDGDSSIVELDKRKRSMQDSPAAVRVDLAMEEIRLLRVQDLKEDVVGRLFSSSLSVGRYHQAFEALVKFGNPALRKASLQSLLQALLSNQSTSQLLSLDFPAEMVPEVDAILLSLARKHLASNASSADNVPKYHAILYAWRIQRDDFRGAAEILYERVQQLRGSAFHVFEPEDETLLDAYLMLINTLACCGQEEGWILSEKAGQGYPQGQGQGQNGGGGGTKVKRRIVTLEDVRRDYQAELDRRSEILQGRYGIVGDAMDVL